MGRSHLSSRERMLAAIRREGPDYVPFSTYIPQGPWFKEPLYWRDQFERAKRMLELGLDPTIEIWLPDVVPHPDVKIKTWRERKGNQVLLTKEYHTPAGVLRQTVRETEDWCDPSHAPWILSTFGVEKRQDYGMHLFDDHNVSRRREPWVKGREDLDGLRYLIRLPEGWQLDEWRMDAERAMEFARNHDLLTIARRTIVGDAFLWFCDIPWFVTRLYSEPDFVQGFFAIFQDWSKKLIELALEVGVDVVQYRGWYEIPSYFGRKCWKKHILPLVEEQAKMVHSAGKLFSYLLPEGQGVYADMLKDMEVDVLQAVDPLLLGRGDLQSLFDTCGKTKSFWGGVNAHITLNSGNRNRIFEEVKRSIEILGANGGLILSALIFLGLPTQSIMWMIEAWRKYRNL